MEQENEYSLKISEEELKIRIGNDYFPDFDNAKKIGKIDFCVAVKLPKNQAEIENFPLPSLLWAEAKKGNKADIVESIIQLIFTIGKEKIFNKFIPPRFLCAFDAEKILFIPYKHFLEIFHSKSDFNWKVQSSDHSTKEFQQLKKELDNLIKEEQILFYYKKNDAELKLFIKKNFSYKIDADGIYRIEIDETNYISIYHRWLEEVKPNIDIVWEKIPKKLTLEADFFVADVLAENHITKDANNLKVQLKTDNYQLHYFEYESDFDKYTELHFETILKARFLDEQKAYIKFWQIYKRPPNDDVRKYILNRRDLLIPQEVRERKGAFYTPKIWVKKAHEYLEKSFGKDWQDNYYIWDCCAGTGNLLRGLTNKQNIFASTLDQPEVDYIKSEKFLYSDNVFQFDFLNDDLFSNKVPNKLKDILKNETLRQKLIILINPPYAEAGNKKMLTGNGKNKSKVAISNNTYLKYSNKLGKAKREIFTQFMIRIKEEICGSKLSMFSTLKALQAPFFKEFRNNFKVKLKKLFIVPANTFDNVGTGSNFPIAFQIYDTENNEIFKSKKADIFNKEGNLIGKKIIINFDNQKTITNWISDTQNKNYNFVIGFQSSKGPDFQNQNSVFIVNDKSLLPVPAGTIITDNNWLEISIYVAVRHCIKADWLNDRDIFLSPNKNWENDFIFQSNCFIYTLFHKSNVIKKMDNIVNNFIPFTPEQMEINRDIESRFMVDFLANFKTQHKLTKFSDEAELVLEKALNLYKYYHQQKNADANASFYDIRAYFQGFKNGKMNSKSNNETYTNLIAELRQAQEKLAEVIQPKIYEYGFLEN